MKKVAAPAKFMSPIEYAGRVGRSARTVRQWLYDGLIPFIKVGKGGVLIDPVKADAALERYERKAVAAE